MAIRHLTGGLTDISGGIQTTFIDNKFDDSLVKGGWSTPISAAQVRSVSTDPGNEANVMVEGFQPLTSGHLAVWRFQIHEAPGNGTIGVGMTTANKFAHGWGCKSIGIRSMGNLCSRGCFRSGWAPTFRQGDTVDLYIETHNDSLIVYPVINDKPPGKNFSVKFGTAGPTLIPTLCPLASFGEGSYSVVMVDYKQQPIPQDAHYKVRQISRTTPDGHWNFRPDFCPSVQAPWHAYKLMITGSSLAVKVANVLKPQAQVCPDGVIVTTPGAPVVSTLMMPIGPSADAEKEVKDWLSNRLPNTWQLVEDGKVLVVGDKKFDVENQDETIEVDDNVIATD